MEKNLLGATALVSLILTQSASAGNSVNPPAATSTSEYNWSGFYLGVAAGGAVGQYDPRTSTVPDGYLSASPAAAVTAAGAQKIKPTGFVTGLEGGYNWRDGNFLLGVEADLQAVDLYGATSSGAIPYPGPPANQFTVTSYGNSNWLFTARPRVGFVAPNNWLIYATGGLALTQLQSNFSFVDSAGVFESGRLNTTKAGYAVGGGVEAPLTSHLSVKVDYLHVDFSNATGAETANINLVAFPDQVVTHSSDLKVDIVRAGLNYRFGGADMAPSGDPIFTLKASPRKEPASANADWVVEAGARLWFSNGQEQEGALLSPPPTTLSSRLIYGGLDALTGETFARVDHTSGFFVKGNLGAGAINSGHLNDEDFPAIFVYSNTLQTASGHIGYATIDLGYNFITSPVAKIGAFIGYNYYDQAINTFGCAQLAGDLLQCSPPRQSASLGITEYDHFDSLRIGLSSQVMLTERLRLTGDAAYLPWVSYDGLDDHLRRQLLGPDASNAGSGVMLEGMLDYKITEAWNIGVGGRYWAWNMNTGTSGFEYLTSPVFNSVSPSRYSAERYGMFVQSSYRWGDPKASSVASIMPTKAVGIAEGPMNWTGFYVGGHLGGGWSDGRWSDPFGPTIGAGGFVNSAGFGDSVHSTGPLGGGQIGADWQAGQWVLGVQADASAANMRGENTCFSGIGGINCHNTVNALGTVTGRIGYAWDHSLAYVKGGAAWTDTTYDLLGNTFAITLGTGSTKVDATGRTLGGGVEYALTNHWTVFFEYDHIGVPSRIVSFPTVAVVSAQTISIRQSVDLFKMGVNYKFDLASLTAIRR